ncbi:gp29 [Aeromonas phage 31]|uniref:Gp29 n=1 Tax=Aeromonas phage 31 TaxID=321023 RepID=Q56EI0_9CAUD|nr:baseplate hub subunit and tail length [Aeromonas phage 31]AAX63670.1 gp29 [Aeromonas phage 31]APU01074.1 baseplate hub protein [Aeromonas phage 31.2]
MTTSLRDLRRQKQQNDATKNLASDVQKAVNQPPNGDSLAAQELIAETVEQGNNELRQIKANTASLHDTAAATELSAESTEMSNTILREISETGKQTFSKLSEFAERLKGSFSADDVEQAPIRTASSSDQAIQIINEENPEPENPLVGYLRTISEDIKFLRENKNEPSDPKDPDVVPDDKDDLKTMIDRIGDQIVKSVDSGFKRTVNIADSISSTLFKYTITAALNFAKMAALVLSLIIAFDVLSRHFSHWTQMFQEQYAEFKETLGSFGTPFENLTGIVTDLVNYFKSDEYLKMFVRLAEGAADQMIYIVNMMMVGLAKLGAAILRALGADDKADTLEASAISVATKTVGYTPSEEEEATIGRVRKRQAQEEAEQSEASWWEKKKREWDGKPIETDEEKAVRERKKSIAENTTAEQFGKHDALSQKIQHVGVTAEKNETSNELLGKHRELLEKRASDVEQAKQSGEITTESYKQLKVEIEKQREFLDAHEQKLLKPKASIKPAPEPEIGVVGSIAKEEKRVEASQTAKQEAASNYNTNANIVKNNNQTLVQAPRTSSPGPGIGNHL